MGEKQLRASPGGAAVKRVEAGPRGNVIVYLTGEVEDLRFTATEIFAVANRSPANSKVIDYYEPERMGSTSVSFADEDPVKPLEPTKRPDSTEPTELVVPLVERIELNEPANEGVRTTNFPPLDKLQPGVDEPAWNFSSVLLMSVILMRFGVCCMRLGICMPSLVSARRRLPSGDEQPPSSEYHML